MNGGVTGDQGEPLRAGEAAKSPFIAMSERASVGYERKRANNAGLLNIVWLVLGIRLCEVQCSHTVHGDVTADVS